MTTRKSGWSPERRQRQREAIQRWKPWERSTGPRTPEGKTTSARNTLIHGLDCAERRKERKDLSEAKKTIKAIAEQIRMSRAIEQKLEKQNEALPNRS